MSPGRRRTARTGRIAASTLRRLASGLLEQVPEALARRGRTGQCADRRSRQLIVGEDGQHLGEQIAMHHPGGLGDGIDDRLLTARQPDREAVGGRRVGVGGSEPVRANGDRPNDGSPDIDRPPGAGQHDGDGSDRLIDEAVEGEGSVGGHVVRHLGEERAGDRDGRSLAHRVDDDVEAASHAPQAPGPGEPARALIRRVAGRNDLGSGAAPGSRPQVDDGHPMP